jgi:hypothetical protein
MKKAFFYPFIAYLIFSSVFLQSCCKDRSIVVTPANGNVYIGFATRNPVLLDSLAYVTDLGNRYMITDLQYFVSRLRFHRENGGWMDVKTDKGLHYVDIRQNETHAWSLADDQLLGRYDSISFVFGLDADDNISFRFPDPPMRDMFWPEILGGGYHYMKMNLKWKNETMQVPAPFMFHLGIGQQYKGDSIVADSIIGYVQNYFTLRFPLKLDIPAGNQNRVVEIIMDIPSWFDAQNNFNFADYPNGIMQNEEGMSKACQNGKKAFSVFVPLPDK